MKDLITLVESKLSVQGNRILFDGKFFHFYADSESVTLVAVVAGGVSHVYGVKVREGCLSFRCDHTTLRGPLVDLVISTNGF